MRRWSKLLARAEEQDGQAPAAEPEDGEAALIAMADGDGRYLLTLAEKLFAIGPAKTRSTPTACGQALQKRAPAYDKDREEHYNLISALHKSDARLRSGRGALLAGAHARGRRGPAVPRPPPDPRGQRGHRRGRSHGLMICNEAAKDTYDFLGSPEGELALAQAVRPSGHRAQVERGLRGLRRGAKPRRARPAR